MMKAKLMWHHATVSRRVKASLSVLAVGVLMACSMPLQAQMQTPGQFAVSPTGAATYTVPIRISPGIAGIEPKLALNYSSQSGNGLFGVGWSLSGLSSITVCPQTKGQDGSNAYAGKTFYTTPNARFCIDGQRLVTVALPAVTGLEATGTAGVAGADQTYYRTELESFALIQSIGVTKGLPTYFKVINRQGQTLEYGNTTDSLVTNANPDASGATREWKLDKVVDKYGNYMTYTYSAPDVVTGQSYPLSISYTANDSAHQLASSSVAFNYNLGSDLKPTRPDHLFSHYPGGTVNLTARVSGITIKSAGSTVKQYNLTYEQGPDTKNSRITQIQECGGDLSTCLPPVVFGWAAAGSALNGSVGPEFTDSTHAFSSSDNWVAADIYNSGIPSILHMYNKSGNLAVDDYSTGVVRNLAANLGAYNALDQYIYADMNGDGRADLVRISPNGSAFSAKIYWSDPNTYLANLSASYSGGINNSSSRNFSIVSDSTGDGIADLMFLNVSTPYNATSNPSLPYGLNISETLASGGVTKPMGTQSMVSVGSLDAIPAVALVAPPYEAVFGDFTGDGVTDFALYSQSVSVQNSNFFNIFDLDSNVPNQYYSTAQPKSLAGSFYLDQYPVSTSLSTNGGATWMAGDVTGDGLTDLIKISNTSGQLSLSVYANDGRGWGISSAASPQTTVLWGSGLGVVSAADKFFIADVNMDGRDDIVHIFNDGGKTSIDYLVSDGVSFRVLHQCIKCDSYSSADKWVLSKNSGGGVYIYRIYADVVGGITSSGFPSDIAGSGDFVVTFNGITSVAYMRLGGARGAYYFQSKTYQYPQKMMSQPIKLVANVTTNSGVGGVRRTRYNYDSAATELGTGRGFLGFNWVESWDTYYGVITDIRTTYRQDFPFVGMVQKIERGNDTVCGQTSCGPNVDYGTVAYQYQCFDFVSTGGSTCTIASGKHYFVYENDIKNTGNHDLTSTGAMGVAMPGVHTTQTYDNWGNLTRSVVQTLDASGAITDFTKTTDNVYAPPGDVTNWRFDRLLRSTVTATGH